MIAINRDAFFFQLLPKMQRCHRISQEKLGGMLVIHKIAGFLFIGKRPSFSDCLSIVSFILFDNDSFASEQILFPLPGIGGHMHHGAVTDCRTHDSDAQSQISGGTHLYSIAGKELPVFLQTGIIIGFLQDPRPKSQFFRYLENLINTASGFYGSRHSQFTVQLNQHTALLYPVLSCHSPILPQGVRHSGNVLQRGLYDSCAFFQFRKARGQEGRKPADAPLCIQNILHGKGKLLLRLVKGQPIRIKPKGFFCCRRFLHLRNCQISVPPVCKLVNRFREPVRRFRFRQRFGVDRHLPNHFFTAFTKRLPYRDSFPVRISCFKKTDIGFINNPRHSSSLFKGDSRKKPLLLPGPVKGSRLIQHMGGRPEIHAVIPYPASVPTHYPGQTAAVCTVHIIRKKLLPFFPFLRLRQIFSPAFPFLLIIRKFFPDNSRVSSK